jgi:hypothetical protein
MFPFRKPKTPCRVLKQQAAIARIAPPPNGPREVARRKRQLMRQREVRVRNGIGQTALGRWVRDGVFVIQMDDINDMHGHGWHVYDGAQWTVLR